MPGGTARPYSFTCSSQESYKAAMTVSVSQTGKLRREVKQLVQGHKASNWWSGPRTQVLWLRARFLNRPVLRAGGSTCWSLEGEGPGPARPGSAGHADRQCPVPTSIHWGGRCHLCPHLTEEETKCQRARKASGHPRESSLRRQRAAALLSDAPHPLAHTHHHFQVRVQVPLGV